MEMLPYVPKLDALRQGAERYPELDVAVVESFLVFLRVASEVMQALDQHFADNALSQGRFTMLLLLHSEPEGALTPSELAKRAEITRGTVTGLLDGLEREGLVQRAPVPENRRSVLVRLTAKGDRLMSRFLPEHFRWIAALMSGLSERDRAQLVTMMRKLGKSATP